MTDPDFPLDGERFSEMHKTIIDPRQIEHLTNLKPGMAADVANVLWEAEMFDDDDLRSWLNHILKLLTAENAKRTEDLIQAMKYSHPPTEDRSDVDYVRHGHRHPDPDEVHEPKEGEGEEKPKRRLF